MAKNLECEENFDAQLASANVVLAIFGAHWCHSCKDFLKNIESGDLFQSTIHVFKVDVDEFPGLADRYKVQMLPTTLMFLNGDIKRIQTGSNITELVENLSLLTDSSATLSLPSVGLIEDGVEPIIPVIDDVFHALEVCECRQQSPITFKLLIDVGLGSLEVTADSVGGLLNIVYDVIGRSSMELLSSDVASLYEFVVPTVSQDGTCSNVHQMAKRPFNLAKDAYHIPFDTAVLQFHPMTTRLLRLKSIILELNAIVQADWVGIYRVVTADGLPSLLKESYIGEPSRALFPLTEEFSKKSTNSWVGLTGKVRTIANTRAREEGVAYYECSGQVQSELCAPILRLNAECGYDVIGIIDLESWQSNHFTAQRVLQVLRVCMDLGSINLGMSR